MGFLDSALRMTSKSGLLCGHYSASDSSYLDTVILSNRRLDTIREYQDRDHQVEPRYSFLPVEGKDRENRETRRKKKKTILSFQWKERIEGI